MSFTIGRGETLGLVGESGCGKTTVGRTILRLYEPTAGEVIFDGEPVTAKNITHMRKQMQSSCRPYARRLDPRMTDREDVSGSLWMCISSTPTGKSAAKKSWTSWQPWASTPSMPRATHMNFPAVSARIGIARALAVNRKFIIGRAGLRAGRVSPAQVNEHIEELQEELGVASVHRTRSVVVHRVKRIAVMYLGKMVEVADADRTEPKPAASVYAVAVVGSTIPDPGYCRARQRIVIEGDVPSPLDMPTGCWSAPATGYAARGDVPKSTTRSPIAETVTSWRAETNKHKK
ncbi:MAG: ABC transporter ATP-binding protein [Oscillospiraceae bacterium]